MNKEQFWKIIDKTYSTQLFEKNEIGVWKLKHPVWEKQS